MLYYIVYAVLYLLSVQERIWSESLKLKLFVLPDSKIFAIIGLISLLLLGIIILFQVLFPICLDITVFDRKYYLYCWSHGKNVLDYVNVVILLIAIVGSMYLGGLAMKLRHLNDQYNETKEIALILYNNTMFLSLILLFLLHVFEFNPLTDFTIISLLWCTMLLIDISILLIPKLWAIYKQVQYLSSGLEKRPQITTGVRVTTMSAEPSAVGRSPTISGIKCCGKRIHLFDFVVLLFCCFAILLFRHEAICCNLNFVFCVLCFVFCVCYFSCTTYSYTHEYISCV